MQPLYNKSVGSGYGGITIEKPLSDEDPHLYLNMNYLNASEQPIPVNFTQQYTQAILDNPSQYQLTVSRFLLPAKSIPLHLWQPSEYVVMTDAGGVDHAIQVTPTVPYDNNYKGYPYYTIYEYLNDLNNAFRAAWINAGGAPALVPFVVFDSATDLLSLIAGNTAFPETNPGIKIYISYTVQEFMYGFNGRQLSYQSLNFKDYLLYVRNLGDNTFSANMFKMPQQGPSISEWSLLRGFFLISNAIGVKSEWVATFNPVDPLHGNSDGAIQPNPLPVITDFQVSIDNATFYQQAFQFIPFNVNNRIIDITSSSPIYKVDISAEWYDNNGNRYPLMMLPGEVASVKIQFKKK